MSDAVGRAASPSSRVAPEGTELTPMNPIPEGTFSTFDTVRPWSLSFVEETVGERKETHGPTRLYVGDDQYLDLETQAFAMLARE